MSHGKPRDPRKEQQWRRWLQQWQNTGLSVRAFCARHHLSRPSFYAWRRELHKRDAALALVPVHVLADQPPPPAGSLEVLVTGGRRLRILPGFDPATLRQLLAVLEETPPC